VVAKKPDLVFIEFGMNDAHVRFSLSVEQTQKNLDDMLIAIRTANRDCDLVLMTMNCARDAKGKTAGTDRPQLADYYANYRTTAAQRKLPFLDLFPLWSAIADKDQEQFLTYVPDDVHPVEAGIMAVTWPQIDALLGAADAVSAR
jgi:acyl-CoA thioesterase I